MNLDRAAKPGNKKLSLVLALMSLCLSLSCPLVGAEAKSKPELLLAKKTEEPKDEESKSAGKKEKSEKSEKSKEKVEKTAREEKAEKTEKAEKAEKADKTEKSDKSEKSAKGRSKKEEKAEKETAQKEEKESKSAKSAKQPKKGFFGFGKEAQVEKAESKEASPREEKKAESAAAKPEPGQKVEEKAAAKEPEKLPEFTPDKALISVLHDLNRSLKDSEEIKAIEDPNEKFVLALAQEVLDKALKDPKVIANRILAREDEGKARTRLTAEAWSSGDVEVSEKFHGSLSAIWAKRIGGLMTLTIAGDCSDRQAPDGKPVNEFLVVITARSPVESGFDIQSQGNVTFWLGKLDKVAVEAGCIKRPEAETSQNGEGTPQPADSVAQTNGDAKKKPLALPPLLTNSYRRHYELVMLTNLQRQSRQKLASLTEAALYPESSGGDEDKPAKTAVKKVVKKVVEKPAEEETEDTADTAEAAEKPVTKVAKATEKKETTAVGDDEEAKVVDEAFVQPKEKPVSEKKIEKSASRQIAVATPSPPRTSPAPNNNSIQQNQQIHQDQVEQATGPRLPRSTAVLQLPERALAGQYLTVAILDDKKTAESNVELSFNGVSLITDQNGQAVYQIPEDASPGRSLNISLTARPYDMPFVVEVLHPLSFGKAAATPPKLDKTTPLTAGVPWMVVDGHNFDGIAHNNRVIIDGAMDGKIIAASPVQLKFAIPEEVKLSPGLHTLVVSTEGMRSNPIPFEYAAAEVQNDSKENNANKIVVKVLGTASKVPVKVVNLSPDVARLNQARLVSCGGAENNVVVPLQRLKKGAVKLQAEIEL